MKKYKRISNGKIFLTSLLTILCFGVVVSGLAYGISCLKNGADATNETIKGWFDQTEKDSTSNENESLEYFVISEDNNLF